MSTGEVWFNGSRPILRVEDMARSVRWYEEVLGWGRAEWSTDGFSSVGRDKAGVYLCRRMQGAGRAWAYVGVDDAEKLYEQVVARGGGEWVRLKPTNFPWAMEMHLEDPDGNVLRFGSDPVRDRPFEEAAFG